MKALMNLELGSVSGLIVVLLLCVAGVETRAERLGPGTFRGYYCETRWGQKVFHCGPYHYFVGDDAAKALAPHAGKPLEFEVLELSQPMNPGAGLIQEVGKITETGALSGLTLTAALKSNKVVHGDGVPVHVTLRNDSAEKIKVWPCKLALILATDSPFSSEQIGYKHPADRAFWYYAYGYSTLENDDKSKAMQIACHQIDVPTEEFGIISLGPKEAFEADFTVGKELLPDDYEVFAMLTPSNNSPLAEPMSRRLAFDVVAKAGDAGEKLPGGGAEFTVWDDAWKVRSTYQLSEKGLERLKLVLGRKPDQTSDALDLKPSGTMQFQGQTYAVEPDKIVLSTKHDAKTWFEKGIRAELIKLSETKPQPKKTDAP